jgi:hypothetical protein
MSVNGPLGVSPNAGALELGAAARTGGPARVATDARGLVALAGILLSGVVLCVAATRTNLMLPETIRPVPSELAGPFQYLGFHLTSGELIGLLALMFGSYALAVRVSGRISPRAAIATILLLNLMVLLAPPLFSTDIFSYEAYARMFATYGTNPYLHGPYAISLDQPLYSFVGERWIWTPSVYGPLFTMFSGLTAGMSVEGGVLFFKLVAELCCLGIVAAVWQAAKLRGVDPVRAALLVGLNPLLVIYGVGGGHNDLLMLLFTTVGVAALLARRERASGAMIVIGAAIKLSGLLLLPFAAGATAPFGTVDRRRELLRGAAATVAIVLTAGFICFHSGMFQMTHTLQDVQSQNNLQSVPGLIAEVPHLLFGGSVHDLVTTLLTVICVLVVARLVWRVWFLGLDWIDGAAWATIWVLATAGSLLPWYVSWLMPLAALATDRRLPNAALWMTGLVGIATVAAYIPAGTGFFGI